MLDLEFCRCGAGSTHGAARPWTLAWSVSRTGRMSAPSTWFRSSNRVGRSATWSSFTIACVATGGSSDISGLLFRTCRSALVRTEIWLTTILPRTGEAPVLIWMARRPVGRWLILFLLRSW